MSKNEFAAASFAIIGIMFIAVGLADIFASSISYLWGLGIPWSNYKGHVIALIAGLTAQGAPMLILGALIIGLRKSLGALVIKITNEN